MKKRVLYIDHTIYKSGAAISLGTLIRNLSSDIEPYFVLRAGSEVAEIIGARGKPIYFERWMPQFMTTLRTPQYGFFLFVWHVLKIPVALTRIFYLKRRWNIQLLHLNETALLPYMYVGWILGIPVVMHARGATAPRPIEQFFLKLLSRFEKIAILAIDEETVTSLPEQVHSITHVVYNPVDLCPGLDEQTLNVVRAGWKCSREDVVIGQVASLHTSKGIWEIVDIASELCPEYPQLKFVLVGDDREGIGEGPTLRKAIAQRGLEKQVLLPGYMNDISKIYGALDIALCLFSGHLGGVGRAAYEAALSGKPLIATLPDPDSSTTVRNGITGLAFKPDDRQGIRGALRKLIESREQRVELGERAKHEIGTRHMPSKIASQVEHIYESLLCEKVN